jgi:hypothetical protein
MSGLRFSAFLLASSLTLSYAQTGLSGGVAPELVRYLQLSPSQGVAINQLVADWTNTLQTESARAELIRGQISSETGKSQPDPATLGSYYVQLESICRRATSERADLTQRTRAVLSTDQLSRLQALDDALQLMPRVIEAQRVGLLPDFIESSPIGLPAGQITVPLAFPATTPALLPGCLPSSQAQPGTVPVIRHHVGR